MQTKDLRNQWKEIRMSTATPVRTKLIAEDGFNMGEYTESVLNYNLKKMCGRGKKFTQKSLITPMGVTSEPAVSQRLNGFTHWTLVSAVNVAKAVGKDLTELLDDSPMRGEMLAQADELRAQAERLQAKAAQLQTEADSLNKAADNQKAVAGNTHPRLLVHPVPPVGLEPTLRRF